MADAHPDEPIFVLRGSDTTAALIVTVWVALKAEMAKNGASKVTPEKLEEARQCAVAMAKWAKAQNKDLGQAVVALAKVFEDFSAHAVTAENGDGA